MDFKQTLRWMAFGLLLLLALCGIGPPPNMNRTKDFENEVNIELVEKRREDGNETDSIQEVEP
jgi:hypothetical protein